MYQTLCYITNTNVGKKDMAPALAGQYTVQFVFKIVLEVWAEIAKLVKGGLSDHQKNTERNVRAVCVYLQPSYLHTISEESLGRLSWGSGLMEIG